MSSVQDALKAREQRKKKEQEQFKVSHQEKKSKVDSALKARENRIKSNMQIDLADLNDRINAEIETIKTISTPSWGDTRKALDSTRESRINVDNLIREVEAKRRYLGDEATDGVLSSLNTMKQTYNSLVNLSQFKSEEDYNNHRIGWLDSEAEVNADTVSARKEKYQSNKGRIAELEKMLPFFAGSSWIPNIIENAGFTSEDQKALRDELEALKVENTRYEREQKALDDYYTPVTDEFLANGAKRDYTNASIEELRNINNNEDYINSLLASGSYKFDEYGNIVNVVTGDIQYKADDLSRAIYQTSQEGVGGLVGKWLGNDPVDYTGQYYNSLVQDKLGMFFASSEEERADAIGDMTSGGAGNSHTWSTILAEGEANAWSELDENELNIYYNLLHTKGQKAAYKFLDDMTVELTRRATQKRADEYSEAKGLEQIFLNVASIGMNVFGNATAFADDAIGIITGQGINPYSQGHAWLNDAQAIRTDTVMDIEKATGNFSIPWLDFSFGDVYQSFMSIGDQLLGLGLGANTYSVLMGMGGASSKMKELYEEGASAGQIVAGGLLAGAAEMVFEKFSIESLINIGGSKTIKTLIVNALKQGGIEASEEMFTEIANTITDAIIMGSQSDLANMEKGEFLKNVINAGLGGFISGGVGGGIVSTVNKLAYNSDMKKQGQNLIDNGSVDTLKQLALEMSGVSKDVGKLSSKVASNPSAKNVGMLSDFMGDSVNAQNTSDIQNALVEKGLSKKDAKRVSQYLFKVSQGYELSEAEAAEVENNDAIAEVWGTVLQPDSDLNKRTKKLALARMGIEYNTTSQEATEQEKIASATENTSEEISTENKAHEVSEDGKTYRISTGEEINIKRIDSVKDGKITLRLDNDETVDASDVQLGSDAEGLLYENVVRMGMSADTANAFIQAFDPNEGLSVGEYSLGFREAYRSGLFGIPTQEIPTNGFFAKLSETKRNFAYNLGKADANKNVSAQQKAKTESIGRDFADKNASSTKKYRKYKGETHISEAKSKDFLEALTESQQNDVQAMVALQEALGINVYLFESPTDSLGRRKGKNGYYNPEDGSIHIDLFAGTQGKNTILFTAAHELTHFIREWSPAKFKVFADLLLEKYGEKGISVKGLIADKMDFLKRKDRITSKMSEAEAYDLAYEEVVADSCEAMLADGDAIAKIAELKAKDQSLWQKIKDFITNLVKKIKAYYQGIQPDSVEGRHVAEMLDSIKQLKALWTDALVDAGDSYSKAEAVLTENGIAVDSKTESASLMSVRDVLDDKQREKVSKALATRFGVTQEEAMDWLKTETSMASLILNPKYSQYLDYTADASEEAIKSNSDYPQGTVDFSNICKKRRDFTEIMNRILRNFPNHIFEPTDLAKIRTIMEQEGMEVACAICYVEDRRQLDSVVAQDFINSLALYREGSKTRPDGKPFNANQLKAFKLIEGDTYTPSIYELISLEGRNELKTKYPAMEEAWVKFNNARGMQSVRLLLNDAEYKRQILKYNKNTVKSKNDNGGLRIYSFSDMEMFHLIDIIQVITDSATVGLSIQGYTKVNEYAKAVKDTGEKLNRSLIPKGDLGYHIEDGKVVLDFDTVEGIDINHPDFFDSTDNPNVGNIVIGINPTQIRAAMMSKFIDYIIPFHTGQSKEVLGEKGIAEWVNYKDSQTEKDIATGKTSKHQINIYTEVIQAAEKEGKPITNKVEFVNKFLEVCKENNLIPRFAEFLNMDENGNYIYTEGYHKFLVDFKTFDTNTGEYLPQMPVKPIFDGNYLTQLLRDYVKSQKVKDAEFAKKSPKVLERITNEIIKPKADTKYSDRDSWNNVETIQGLEWYSVDEVIDIATSHIQSVLEEYGEYAEIIAVRPYGSRAKGTAKTDSDLDIVVQYEGDIREDDMFGMLNDDESKLYIDGIEVDINPIRADDTGDIEDYLGRVYDFDKYNPKYSDRDSSTLTKDFLDHMMSIINGRGEWYSRDVFDYVAEHPEFNFIERIYAKDKTIKSDLEQFLKGIESVNVLKAFSHYLGSAYLDKAPRWRDGKFVYPYRGSVTTFRNAIKRRINEIQTAKVNGTNLGVKNGEVSFDEIRDLFNRLNSNKEIGELAEKVFATAEKLGVNIRFANQTFSNHRVAGDALGDMVEYKTSYFNDTARSDQRKASVILHELIHTCTAYAIENGSSSRMLVGSIAGLNNIFTTILNDPDFKGQYGITNVKEMVAELSNENFVALLKKKSLWQKILDWFAQFFGFTRGTTAYDGAMQCLDAMLDNPEISEYKTYASSQRVSARGGGYDVFGKTIDNYGQVRYSDRDLAPTFYSHMGKVVDEIKSEKVGAGGVVPYLKGKGVKHDEIKWSGIEAWLEGKKSVTKAELQEFIQGSQLQIEEEMSSRVIWELVRDGENWLVQNKESKEILTSWEHTDDGEGMEGWFNFDYGEIVTSTDEMMEYARDEYGDDHTRWSKYRLDGGENYRELVFKMPNSSYSNNAMKAHWGEDAEGVLAHARIQDFDVDGKKMLFIEEIQSDWHNEGAKKGYEETEARIEELKAKADEAFFKLEDYSTELTGLAGEWETVASTPKGLKLYNEYIDANAAYKEARDSFGKTPDAPFRSNYHEYVLKRLIRMAAEEGYDSIGWTTADIQSKRWSDNYAEGYRIEYDQDIPSFLKKYGKKWGATVGKTKLSTKSLSIEEEAELEFISDIASESDLDTFRGNREIWSMDITDSMKESVLYEGQVLYSDRYSYETLTSKPDMKVTIVDESVPNNRADIVYYALKNAASVGSTNKSGNAVIHVNDIDTDIIVPKRSIVHGLDRRMKTQAPVLVKIGNVLENSIRINELIPRSDEVKNSYVLIGAAQSKEGNPYIASFVVNKYSNEVTEIDVLYSANAKKESAALLPKITDKSATPTDSKISIAQLLDFVNDYFPDILPESVLRHYGYDARPEGKIGKSALYSDRIEDGVSNRSLLANALESVAQNDIERRRLKEYKEKISLIESEQAKLSEIRQKLFSKGGVDPKQRKDLQFEAKQIANRINTYDRQLLNLEATAALKGVLQREKQMAYKRAEEKGREALAKYREKAQKRQDDLLKAQREKRKEAVTKVRETRDKNEAKDKLQKLVLDTAKWISYPKKDDAKCPDFLKAPYSEFLKSIDLSSKRSLEGGDATLNDIKVANAMNSLANAIEKIKMAQDPSITADNVLDSGYLDLPSDFVEKLRNMAEGVTKLMVDGDYVINKMSSAGIKQLSQLIRTLNHAIKEMSTLYSNLRFANVEALGYETMKFLDDMGELKSTNSLKEFMAWDNALPYYAFKRFGEAGESVFTELMDAQDKLANLASEIFAFKDKTWTDKEAKAWGEDVHTINLPGGNTLTLTTADAMGIYCLSRREQARPHLLMGGVRVLGIKKGAKKLSDSHSSLTQEDLGAIISSLTDRQKKVAEAIQGYMSTVCSNWGNEISMKRFLTSEFTEEYYYPIESNDENLAVKDPKAQQSDLYRLLNISATKPLTPKANNEIIIRNIFDVFVEHASDMARLNAFGMPLLDYMKWINYHESILTGEDQRKDRSVRKSMRVAYEKKAEQYVIGLIKDINGRFNDNGDNKFLMNMMRMAKVASVGNNLRVVLLQITSYPRAAEVLSLGSLAKGLTKVPSIEKAKKYCGIALWKSFGFYDTNIARSIEEQVKGSTNIRQKLIELSMKGAEWADAITWGALWNACEYEVAKTTKNKVGSEEFYQEVGKKLREVVYATQVVDSVLTRSQIMRSKSGLTQGATSFMSEPTLSYNILADGVFQFEKEKRITGSAKTAWRKTRKAIGRKVAIYSSVAIVAALMEGLADAWRDDEDEEFGKKFGEHFGENLISDIIPFNKIPIFSDIVNFILSRFGVGFFSEGSLEMTWLGNINDALDAWADIINEKFNEEDTSTTVYSAIYKTTKALSSMLGIAVSGVMREVVALWNNTAGAYDSTLKIRGYELSNEKLGNSLFDAIVEGDTDQADSIKEEFDDEDSMESALRKTIRTKYEEGELTRDDAMKMLIEHIGMEQNDAYWKMKEWDYRIANGTDEGYSKYTNFYEAVRTGKNLKAVISEYTSHGVESKTLASQITSYFKPLYIEMTNSERASIKGYLLNAYSQLGYDRNDRSKAIDKWLEQD